MAVNAKFFILGFLFVFWADIRIGPLLDSVVFWFH